MIVRGCIGLSILALISFCLISFGLAHISEGRRFREPKTLTYDQFVALAPTEGWFRITGATLSVSESAHIVERDTEKGSDTDNWDHIYVPLRPSKLFAEKSHKPIPPIQVLVETDERDVVRMHIVLMKTQSDTSRMVAHQVWHITRDVQGMVGAGLHTPGSSDEAAIEKVVPNLRAGCIQLEEGAKPSVKIGIAQVVGGFALGGFLLILFVGKRSKEIQRQ